MVRWLVGMSLKYRYIIVFIALVVIIMGIIQLRSMPVGLFP
jgi:Cu/Ag efflux pump CusA